MYRFTGEFSTDAPWVEKRIVIQATSFKACYRAAIRACRELIGDTCNMDGKNMGNIACGWICFSDSKICYIHVSMISCGCSVHDIHEPTENKTDCYSYRKGWRKLVITNEVR